MNVAGTFCLLGESSAPCPYTFGLAQRFIIRMIEHGLVAPGTRIVPHHVAIIMDGNRRWARERGLAPVEGHHAGGRALREVAREAGRLGIGLVTAHVFSEENRLRDAHEAQTLMEFIALIAGIEPDGLIKENVRVRTIGRTDRLPPAAYTALAELVAGTQACTGLLLTLAVEYGARAEIRDAVRALARDVARGALKAADVNERTLTGYLSTADLPDPDLLIRTGGELRLSNFLLYQAAYSELWSTTRYWPDFDARLLDQAVADFAKRQRRFGS
jgi:undecaprenyl diphosphate synthase